MDIYSLYRNFWDWCFENPEKIKPNHIALYSFSIEHCNRLGWKEKFGLPTTMAKEAIGIKSYTTYIKTLNELVEWGFILMLERSKNQYSANIIALTNFDKASVKALDKALIKHVSKQVQSTCESIVSIDKQIYNNTNLHIYTENEFLEDWTQCRKTFLNVPTNFKSIKTYDLPKFNKAVNDYSKDQIREAMRGLFMQEVISFSSMTLQPSHFLENVDKYYNAFISKDKKLYGSKPVQQ